MFIHQKTDIMKSEYRDGKNKKVMRTTF